MQVLYKTVLVTDLVLKGSDGLTYSVDGLVDLRAPDGDTERAEAWDSQLFACYVLNSFTGEGVKVVIDSFFARGSISGRAYVYKNLIEQMADIIVLEADKHLLNAPTTED